MWPSFDTQRYPYATPDSFSSSYIHALSNLCSYINTDADADTNGNGNPDRNPHANTDINTDRNPDTYSYAYS